jgi:hypothetical protein
MGKTKTLKQIAIDACNGADLETEDVWDNVASAVRKAVLEEAIAAAAKTHWGHLDGSGLYDRGMNSGATEMRDEIVKALTRLMGDE